MKKGTAWMLCAIWMGVIYCMSAAPGDVSGSQSGLVVDLLQVFIRWVSGGKADISADLLGLIVRKGAHMMEYAVLFLLYRRALELSGAPRPALTALVMSALYAATDEWHQGFVADRNPSPIDVGIDTLGAGIALGVQSIWKYRKKEC